jgi:hypothetical protein
MSAEYLIRLDDACPTMDSQRWEDALGMLTSYAVKPIVAIIPANQDPELFVRPMALDFWEKARSWALDGCMIALHGYSHVLRPSSAGLVPVHRFSEFVGLPIDEQRRRIRAGVRILEDNGLEPRAWVAPAHGFDSATLEALRAESRIRVISDGFMRRAVYRWDFVWLPQQLWRPPRDMKKGLWTICIHPNNLDARSLRLLKEFVATRPSLFANPHDVVNRASSYSFMDELFSAAFRAALRARQLTKQSGWNRK